MEKQQAQQMKLIKLLVILASVLLVILLFVGFIQTWVHNGLLRKQDELNNKNNTADTLIDNTEKDNEFLTNEDGEVIITQP